MTGVPPCLKEFDGRMVGFRITIEGSDRNVTCLENEPLLIALARQGCIEVPVGCRKGGCGVCKIRVNEGEFETGKMSVRHVSLSERKDNYTLSCKTFPKSDLTITVKI